MKCERVMTNLSNRGPFISIPNFFHLPPLNVSSVGSICQDCNEKESFLNLQMQVNFSAYI
eukprot:UN02169